MYISIRRYKINDTQTVSEIARMATEGFVPIISQTPGFIAYYGIDAGENVVATVSIFEDQAGADESTQRAGEWVRQNLAQYVAGAPQVTAGEVRFQKTK